MKRVLAATVALLAISAAAVQAQYVLKKKAGGSTGIISGLVLGPDDKPAPHAAITYQSGDGTSPHAVHADSHGRFTITKLRSDNYDLRATANGIFSEWQKNFQVQSGRTSEITLHLIYAKEMPKSKSKSTKKN
ncbi:MAG TPA: carboxypeptidase-like regulatory domain-containing protein [Candidatus Acidoferrum sp.]|nr:carboxypeptidase-like regulatory domain-containing protein [Candidatus Acidoferrum sp.]